MRQAWSLARSLVSGTKRATRGFRSRKPWGAMLAAYCLLATPLLGAETRRVQKMTQPQYPALALRMRVEGVVKLQTVVNADGRVEDVKVLSGHTLLKSTAVECVKQWQYEPTGEKSVVPVEVNFRLPSR